MRISDTVWPRLRSAVLTLGALLGAVCVLWTLAVAVTGVKPLVLLSGSMSPALNTGDLAFARTVPAADLKVGDIVSVPTVDGVRVTHRVASIAAGGQVRVLRLKGDANASIDDQPYEVASADRVVARVPKAGYVVGFLGSRWGVGLSLALIASCLALAFGPLLTRRTPGVGAAPGIVAASVVGIATLAAVGATLAPARTSLAYFSDTPKVRTLDTASGKGIGAAPWLACDRVGSLPGSGAWAYYDLDETSGATATSATGSNNGTYLGVAGTINGTNRTYVRSQPHACQFRDTGTSVLFNPSNPGALQPGMVISPNAWGTGANQWNDFTVSVWFKTRSTGNTTGPLIVMKNTGNGTIGTQGDRRLWMTQNGRVSFGVQTNTANYLTTAGRYDDGNWHLATGVLSSTAGLSLYLDGVLQAIPTTNTGAAASSIRSGFQYTGGVAYWSVARGDRWDSSARYLDNGWIDEVGIWKRALTATEVRDIYRSSIG